MARQGRRGVTGAGRGMGRAHALLLAERGADVVVQDIRAGGARRRRRGRGDAGGEASVLVCDVADVPTVADAGRRGARRLGKHRHPRQQRRHRREPTIEETTEDDFDRMFAVHVKGAFFGTQAVVPGMKEQRRGKIVNISSIWGMVGTTTPRPTARRRRRSLGLTKAWAKELAPWNIHVNAVAPGRRPHRDGAGAARHRGQDGAARSPGPARPLRRPASRSPTPWRSSPPPRPTSSPARSSARTAARPSSASDGR